MQYVKHPARGTQHQHSAPSTQAPQHRASSTCSVSTSTFLSVPPSATTATSIAACSTRLLKARYVERADARSAVRSVAGQSRRKSRADTIYFGGGTPSLLEPDENRGSSPPAARRSTWPRIAKSRSRPIPKRVTEERLAAIGRPASIGSVSASNRFERRTAASVAAAHGRSRADGSRRGARGPDSTTSAST